MLEGTGCTSLGGLFGTTTVWREYIEKVPRTRAWQARLGPLDSGGPGDTVRRGTPSESALTRVPGPDPLRTDAGLA